MSDQQDPIGNPGKREAGGSAWPDGTIRRVDGEAIRGDDEQPAAPAPPGTSVPFDVGDEEGDADGRHGPRD